jgi:hypothetical protein
MEPIISNKQAASNRRAANSNSVLITRIHENKKIFRKN